MAPILSSPNSNEITETHSQNYEVVGYCTAKNSKPASVITWIAPPERFHQIFKSHSLSEFSVNFSFSWPQFAILREKSWKFHI